MGKIIDYPNQTEPCDYCDGTAHKIKEVLDGGWETCGYQCNDCRRVMGA